MSERPLEGATAVVTGAASGIGLALVRRLVAAGADVVGVDIDAVEEMDGVRAVTADVSDPEAWAALAHRFARVDYGFLNAGTTSSTASFLEASWAEARTVLRVNLEGVLLGVRALSPLMRADGGAIVVTGSGGAVDPVQTDPVYTASKHGVVGLVRAAAEPLAARGVRLAAVCPSLVDTPLLGEVGRLMRTAGFALLSPDDVAEVLVRAAREAEPGAVWGLRPDTGAFPLVFPRFEPG